jgi:antitoxin HicB
MNKATQAAMAQPVMEEGAIMRYAYPYVAAPQPEGGFSIVFPDIPEAISQGETEEEVRVMAEDALVTALSFYTDASEPLPRPSPAKGSTVAFVPPLVAAKLALHDAMVEAKISNIVLAHRLGVDEKTVRRLRDPLHRSHIANIDAALRVLGKRLLIETQKAA